MRTYLMGTVSYPAMREGVRYPMVRVEAAPRTVTATTGGSLQAEFKSRRVMPNGDIVFTLHDGSTLRAPGRKRQARAA